MAKQLHLDPSTISVMIGMPCVSPHLPYQTVLALMNTAAGFYRQRISFSFYLAQGIPIVEAARSRIAAEFLGSPANRLALIDADMVWRPEDLIRLLALSTVMDVVGAAYATKTEEPKFHLKLAENGQLNDWGCLPIDGLGLGFTVITRNAMERLSASKPKATFGDEVNHPIPHLYRCDVENGAFVGEDMAFFADIREHGIQPYLDPSITLGHVGTKVYTASVGDKITLTVRRGQ